MNNTQLLYGWYDQRDLKQGEKVIAEYIWIDGSGIATRSKQRTFDKKIESIEDLPEWNYDGSSTEQATTQNSEVTVRPVAIYPDPFRKGDNILVLCEAWLLDREEDAFVPANTNFRHFASQILDKNKDAGDLYGFEQEYTLMTGKLESDKWPLGWPIGGFPDPQGPYHCAVGATVSFGRPISDAHYKACLYCGLDISGTNAETMPGSWEYQIGPTPALECAD